MVPHVLSLAGNGSAQQRATSFVFITMIEGKAMSYPQADCKIVGVKYVLNNVLRESVGLQVVDFVR